jgi:hypothetical protein
MVDLMRKKRNSKEKSEEELQRDLQKQLSPKISLMRIFIAIFAFIWFLAGGSAQTVLSLSGGAIGLSGVVSYLIRNPLSFLLIGVINVILGLILFVFEITFILLVIFHFLWSIRWFYGFFKYRKIDL